MDERKRIFRLILVMATACMIVAGISIAMLYDTAFNEESVRMMEIARSQARLIEAEVRFDAAYTKGDFSSSPVGVALSQVIDSHERYKGFGETGEFTLARREGDKIVFLISHRHNVSDVPGSVPFDSAQAEPMRRALSGDSGIMVGVDYRGKKVLTAYESMAELNLGVVAKIDLDEIRAPFAKAGSIALASAVIIILVGARLFFWISGPMMKRNQIILDTALDGFWIIDMEGRLLETNNAYCRTTGYSRDELLTMNISGIEVVESTEQIARRIRKVREIGWDSFETQHRCKDGRVIDVAVSINYMDAEGGRLFAFMRDITERKRVEKQLKGYHDHLEDLVAKRTAELARNYETQAIVNSLMRLSLEESSLDKLLNHAIDLILSIPGFSFETKGSIFLVEDDPAVLILRAVKGLPASFKKDQTHVPLGQCICGRVALSKKMEFVEHVEDCYEILFEGIISHGHYCIPIMAADETLGVLNLFVKKGFRRDLKKEGFLSVAADTLAGIILRKREEEENIRLAAFPRDNPNPIISSDLEGNVIYVNPSSKRLMQQLGVERVEGFLPENHKELIEKCIQHDSEINSIEVLIKGRFLSWSYHSTPSLNVIHLYANNITARKQTEAIKEQMFRLKDSFISASLLISGKLMLKDMINETLSAARRLSDARYAALAMVEDEKIIQFVPLGLSGKEISAIDHWPEGKGLLSEIISRKTTIRISDISRHPRACGFPAGHPRMKSFLGTPIIHDNALLGILYLADKRKGEVFSEADQGIIEVLASHSAAAMHKAKLYENIRSLNRDLDEKVKERTSTLEKAVHVAEAANRAKSDFLASMSHELRTPLNAIIGFSEVLRDQYFGKLNEKQTEYSNDILDSGKHLLSLINDILDLSKIEAGKLEFKLSRVHVKSLLGNSTIMVKEKAMKHGISLNMLIPEELSDLDVMADERKLKQILVNLLTNAVKFTLDGGAIEVEVDLISESGKKFLELEGKERQSVLWNPESKIQISVLDTGIGISPRDQEKIFEEFYQAKSGTIDKTPGTGLGLSLTRHLVEMHGGKIWVESKGQGKGSQFNFVLPLNPVGIKDGQAEAGKGWHPDKMLSDEILSSHLKKEINLSRKSGSSFALCRFHTNWKRLKEKATTVAEVLEKEKRGNDFWGMDKDGSVSLILTKTDQKNAADACGRFNKILGKALEDRRVFSTVAIYPKDGDSAEAILRKVNSR